MATTTTPIKDPTITLTIKEYCNENSIEDRLSFVYCLSFGSEQSKSKEDWDLFLQNKG
jgi:hypothetical protein